MDDGERSVSDEGKLLPQLQEIDGVRDRLYSPVVAPTYVRGRAQMFNVVHTTRLNTWELIDIHSQAPPVADEDGKCVDALHEPEPTCHHVKLGDAW